MPQAQTKGAERLDAPQTEEWQNMGWIEKFAHSLGLRDIYTAIDDYFTGRPSQERQFKMDVAKLEMENAFTEKMWNKTNEYNTTKEQLKRWLEAGGNANAFFAGGTNTGNASSASSGTAAPTGSTIGTIQGAIGQTTDSIKSWWENRKLKAEAEGKEIENGTLRELNETTIQEIKGRIALQEKEGKLKEAEARQIELLLPGLVGKTNAEWDQIKQQTLNLISENEEIKERTKNLRQDTRKKLEETEKLKWEKLFREQYGVDPNSGPVQMLIQTILSGKGKNVLQTLMDYVDGKNVTKEMIEKFDPNKKIKPILKAAIYGNPGIPGITYSAFINYRKKHSKDWKNH